MAGIEQWKAAAEAFDVVRSRDEEHEIKVCQVWGAFKNGVHGNERT
jgi:hypothetical protein